MSNASTTNAAAKNGHAITPPDSDLEARIREKARGGFWRARLVQTGHTAFFCTGPFQAPSESAAIAEAMRITGRGRKELEVEAVSNPGIGTKGKKK